MGVTDWSKNSKVPKELVRSYAAAGMDVNDPKVKERMKTYFNEHMSNRTGGVNVG